MEERVPIDPKKLPFSVTQRHSKVSGDVNLEIGKHALIKSSVVIDMTADITIGEYTEIQDYVMIFTHKHHWRHSRGLRKDTEMIEPVPLRIGRDVFIGVNAVIIGVREIGDGAVIGASAVITKDVGPYEIWVGNPAVCKGVRQDGN